MAMKDRRQHGRKRRRERLVERNRRSQSSPQPYRGKQYRTNELVPFYLETEIAIYESYEMTRRNLTDDDVRVAMQILIARLQAGPLSPLVDSEHYPKFKGRSGELVAWNIRRRWQLHFEDNPRPTRDKMIGVMRTILGSIEVWKSAGPNSQGYLHYIVDFLNEAGVSVEVSEVEQQSGPDDEDEVLESTPPGLFVRILAWSVAIPFFILIVILGVLFRLIRFAWRLIALALRPLARPLAHLQKQPAAGEPVSRRAEAPLRIKWFIPLLGWVIMLGVRAYARVSRLRWWWAARFDRKPRPGDLPTTCRRI